MRLASPAIMLSLIVSATAAVAHDQVLLARGQEIAARCARCHAIGPADDPPQRITPPFRDLYRRYPIDMLVEAARTGVIEGHDEMPEFVLDAADLAALFAYIDSLNPTVPGYRRLIGAR